MDAFLFFHQHRNRHRRQQSRHQRHQQNPAEIILKRHQQQHRRNRSDNRAARIHHPLESERPAVSLRRDRAGQQRFSHRRPHTASEPRPGPAQQNMPRLRRQPDARRTGGRQQITNHRNRFAPAELVGEITGTHFCKARDSVGNSFNQAEPNRRRAECRQKCRHDGRGDFVRPIAQQRRQPNAEHRPVEPTVATRSFHTGLVTEPVPDVTVVSESRLE